MVRLIAPSINKLLVTALPPEPPHTNILKDDAPQLLTDGSATTILISSSLQNNTLSFSHGDR